MHKGPKMNSARRRSCKIARRELSRSNLPSRLKMMPSTAGHASLRHAAIALQGGRAGRRTSFTRRWATTPALVATSFANRRPWVRAI